MRTFWLILVGTVGGGATGAAIAFFGLWGWMAAGLPIPGEGPKPGLDVLAVLLPLGLLAGAIVAPRLLVKRARAGRSVAPAIMVMIVPTLVMLLYVAAFVG